MKVTFDRSWFQKANKTQRQVAEENNLDEAYLSKVVHGRIEPSVAKAMMIADSLGCKVDDLYQKDKSASRRTRSVRRADSKRRSRTGQ